MKKSMSIGKSGGGIRIGNFEWMMKFFFIAVAVSAVLNGSAFWLKRVGWLDVELYNYYWNEYKYEFVKKKDLPKVERNLYLREKLRLFTAKIYDVRGGELVLKLCKDFLFIFFLFYMYRFSLHVKPGFLLSDPLMFILLILLGYCFIRSCLIYGPFFALAGLRNFMFLGVAVITRLTCRKLNFSFLSMVLFFLVLFQGLLLPIEIKRGVHLFAAQTSQLIGGGDRVVGTFLQPSSLAIVTVFFLSFYYAYSNHRKSFVIMLLVSGLIIFFAGSGVGFVVYMLVLFWVLIEWVAKRTTIRIPLWLPLIGIFLLLCILPEITRRPFVYDSLWGRILQFENNMLTASGSLESFLGKGIGVATNVTANLLVDWYASDSNGMIDGVVFVPDSMALSVGLQMGWVGIVLIYLLIFRAAWRDRQAWGVYAVIFFSSLTMNILELFPVNFILGLLLAKESRAICPELKPECAIRNSLPV